MWPKSFLNEPNNKSLDGGRGDKNASEKQENFDFSEPFKISNKQQLSPLKANTSGMTKSLFGQLNYPIVVSPGGDMMFKFEKPPVRLNGILHRAVDSIVHDDTSISSQSTFTESSQSDSQIIFAVPINAVSTSFRRSSSPNKQLQSRDSSSNSILAALKSLGTKSNSKFSSIFIKPKTAKHIEQSAFYTKKEKDEMNVDDDEKTSKNRKSSRSAFDNNKILGILPEEPKEIRLNESVEELLKRFSYEDSLFKMSQDQTTRSRPHLFTTSGAVVSSSSSNHQVTHLFNYRAKSKVKNVNNNDTIDWLLTNGQQSDKKSSSGISGSQFGLKWTCLVCLSKHLNYVNVCSICGSSKPDESISRNTTTPFATTSLPLSSTIQLAKSRYSNLNQSKSMLLKNHQQFSAYLLNRLGYSELDFEQKHQQTTDTPTTVSASTSFSTSVETNDKKITNPYLKKWTCRYCNFSNDSLKIVCLNCRWVKTCTTERSSNDSNLSKLIIARSSGDEFKHFQSSKKATEEVTQKETTPKLDEEICCATCKTPIRETSKAEVTIVKTVIGDKEKVVEKTKESDKLEADKGQAKEPSLSEIFNAGGGKKWKCTTCLVMNADTLDKCSCCATSRPDLSTSSESSTVSVTVPTDKSKAFSLETTNNNTKPFLNPFQSSQLPSQTFSPSITQKPNDTTTKTTTESPLAGIFNNQNKWKCNTCLIMNDNDKTKCVACQTEKPDTISKASKTTAAGFSLFTQTPLFPSSSVSTEGLTKKTTNEAVAPQSTPNITLPLPTPSTISTTAISSTLLPSATSAQFKPSLGLPTSTTGFKIDFSTAFSNKDSSFKLPLPASATPSASTQATITPFNLAQTPSLGGADTFFGGFKAASSTTTSTTTASATQSFTLPSSISSGFSFNTTNQQNTNANSSAPSQVTFGFNPSNTTASLFGTTTTTTSSRQPKDTQATTLSTTSAISTPNQLAPTISFGSMSTPTTTINTSTLGATSTILDKPSTEFNFQAGVNLLHANKRPNMDPIPNFSSNKTPNTNIGGTNFPSFNLSTSTPTSFMINTSPQTSAATLSNVPSGSFPSLLNPNSNSATTSFSTTTPAPISLFNSGSTFLSPSSTGSQSLSNNMFSNTGLTQQPKFNFSSTGFSMTPHINFTSTESPFKFSASNETHSTPATEVRKIRRATRRK